MPGRIPSRSFARRTRRDTSSFDPTWRAEMKQYTQNDLDLLDNVAPITGVYVGSKRRSVVVESDLKHYGPMVWLFSSNREMCMMSLAEAKSQDVIAEMIDDWLAGNGSIERVVLAGN